MAKWRADEFTQEIIEAFEDGEMNIQDIDRIIKDLQDIDWKLLTVK